MFCCAECFGSNYIKSLVEGSGSVGNCDFCGSQSVKTLPANSILLFRVVAPFIEIYEPKSSSTTNLYESIYNDFNGRLISRKLDKPKGVNLLKEILTSDESQHVSLSFDDSISLTDVTWDTFTEELKRTNRFHISNTLDFEELELLFRNYHVSSIPAGTVFYRARKSRQLIEHMGMPPVEKTGKGGRINPIGIPYLYLSSSIETTFYETRASLFDEITVAKFVLSDDIKVYDLRKESMDFGFIAEQEKLRDYLPYASFIQRLEEEMSKPNLETEKELEYLPTQYIAEYIKVLGYDGILYSSSLHPTGYNLALFKQDKVRCENIVYHKIMAIEFVHQELT